MKSELSAELDFLLTRYLENKCTEEEKNRLFMLLGDLRFDNISKEELLTDLSGMDDDGSDIYRTDLEEIYKRIETEIAIREIRAGESGMLPAGMKLRKIIVRSIYAAALVLIAFFTGAIVTRHNELKNVKLTAVTDSFTMIKAPFGSKSEITLSDGTEIILNAGSSVTYNNSYSITNRDLILEGEAYFKVAENKTIPLIVYAGNLYIRATGTEFNVKAYSEDGIIETTLIKGEVEISQKSDRNKENVLVLKPNQKAIYARQDDQLTLERKKEMEPQALEDAKSIAGNMMVSLKTDVEQVTAWTKNRLIIRSENLESLCTKLQRKYNVTFVFRDEEIKKHRFSGILLDETFSQVMDVIMLTAPVSYEMEGRTVYLFARNQAEKK
ncbi:MAG: DUF4974 domain-containing protein [Bacteroidales bacterium]|nr:DUF4974 domain-containing protein [Bacteroidales bacterium]